MRMFVQSPAWNPFQTMLMIACTVAGLTGLVARSETSVAVAVLPDPVLNFWYGGLLIGGLGALAGMHLNFKRRLTVKIASFGILAGITWGYAVALFMYPEVKAFAYSVVVIVAFAAACTVRIYQLMKVLHHPEKSQEVVSE